MTATLHFIEQCSSTNAEISARLAEENALGEGHWLIADRQTGGRGRLGRVWEDGAGNFMGSTLVELAGGDPAPHSLSFVAALAVFEAAHQYIGTAAELQLKWPNDVLLGGAKLSGILLERQGQTVIVGIGVNLLHAPDLPDRKTTAIGDVTVAPSKDVFAATLAQHFALGLARWRKEGLAAVLQSWQSFAHPIGTRLSVHDQSGVPLNGRFTGLESDGALRLSLEDGSTRVMHAGDIELE